MSLFKKKTQPIELPKECQHKWKDFHWYADFKYHKQQYGNKYEYFYKIYEPYVCIYCHKRKDVILEFQSYNNCYFDWIMKDIERIKKSYPELKEKAKVQDEINDFIMVDRDYLAIAQLLNNPIITKKDNVKQGVV